MFFCASADDALYLYKILQNIFNTYKVIEWIQLPYVKLQRGVILSKMYVFSAYWVNYDSLYLALKVQSRQDFQTSIIQ